MDKFSESNDNALNAMNSFRGCKLIVEAAETKTEALLAELEASKKSNAFLKEQLAKLANFNPDWDMLEACRESWREVAAALKEAEANLEAKDKTLELELEKSRRVMSENHQQAERIAELERANQSQDDHINQQQDRIDSLEKTNTGLGRRLGEAEKRLASPIKIVNYDEFFICHVTGASDDYCKGWVDGRNAAARDVGKAGFTVEGDE